MKKGKEKKQPKQPLTPNKAFKAVLPVLVCIVLFIVIGITLVIIGNNKGNNPKVTSPDDTYLQFGNYRVTREEMYETLRKDYGLTEVIRQIDELIFKDEVNQVNIDSEKYVKFLNDKFFSESKTDDDKKKAWNELLDSAVISATITKADADAAKDKFDDTTTAAWVKLANSYKLEYAREQWAIKQFLANYRIEKGLAAGADVISEDEIKNEYKNTYGENATNGGKNAIAIVIPFTSEEAAKKLMASYGINTEVLGTYTDGWVKSTFDEKGTEKPKETDYFTEDEIMKIFCDMYNEVLGYYTGSDIITSEKYTLEYDAVKTLAKMKKVLNVKMQSYATVKQNIDLPTTIQLSDVSKTANIKWVQKIKDGDETKEVEIPNGKLEVVVPEEGSSTSINLSATISFADDEENHVSVSYSIVVKPEAEEITEPFETTLTAESGNNWTFSLNNEMGNEHSKFVWSYDDTTDLGKYVLKTLKLGTYPGAYTIKPTSLSSSSSSNKYYYLIIKVGNEDGKTLEELHDKIKEDLTKALYSANYSLERYYFEERAKHNIVFYDHYLERLYQFAYETCYQTLKVTDFAEYKLNKKKSKTVVAKIDELSITADDLFTSLETKYSSIYATSSINRYQILKDNVLYNPWTNKINKKYVNKAVKADVNSVKNYFALDYFANYYGYYYFRVSPYNFDSSYGWDNFIKDYYGVSEEKDLLLLSSVFGSQGRIYADSLRTYRNKVITYDIINEQIKKRNNPDKLYDVDVLNVVIYVDYDYDGTPDTKISASNTEDVTEENWSAEQIQLAYKLAEIFMTKEDLIENGEDGKEKTRYEKLEEMVNIYNQASCRTNKDESNEALTNLFAEFKKAGLFVKLEKSTFDQCDSLVDEFHEAMHKMWAVAKESEEGLTETHNMLYDVVESGKYAFSSPYGYHAVVVTDFRQPVDAPTADEFELYRAMAIVEANRKTIESVTKSLDSDNVKSNKTLRESYNAELNLAKAEITKYLEIAQKYTTDIVDENYKMSDTLKKKIDKWVESVDDVDGSTDPDIEKNTSSLVITSLLNDLLVELDKDNIKFASTFNKEQLRLYINNLIESYNEEK